MKLFCVGLSHHTANVELRERYAPAAPLELDVCKAIRSEEALLLTTCNRVEIYGAAKIPAATETIGRFLLRKSEDRFLEDATAFYRYENDECVQHLFRVVCGLDSMVLGETEILGQAKRAYEQVRTLGGVGQYLHQLFQQSFRVAKQVRTRTQITRGPVSVGSVAVDLAQKIFGNLRSRSVLLLGAGETGKRTARALTSRGVADLRIANRSGERATALAALVGGRSISFDSWQAECRSIDILISATGAATPLLTREMLSPVLQQRVDRPLFIIDMAVPRDVAPDVNEMEGVYLYDMDSLQTIAAQSLALRQQQVAAGEEIIAQHVRDFRRWHERAASDERARVDLPRSLTDEPLPASEF